MALGWPDDYPSPASVRKEVDAMVASIAEALLRRIPASQIAGIYFKGSAQRRWDSLLDYVPEISDVDVHVLFRDDESVARRLGTVEEALAIQSHIEAAYRAKVASPLHTPRPQLTILNHLLRDPEYSPSPRETVTTLHGDDYPEATYDEHRERELACARMLSHCEALKTLPLRVVDRPGSLLLTVVRDLTWRVSPSGPRVLSVLGMPAAQAWSLNRTEVVAALEEQREGDLATSYRDFYLSAWAYFLSRYADSAAARSTVRAGAEVLRRAAVAAGVPPTER